MKSICVAGPAGRRSLEYLGARDAKETCTVRYWERLLTELFVWICPVPRVEKGFKYK